MGVITVSRQFGSGGEIIARMVADRLGYLLVNREMIEKKLQQYGIPEPDLALFDERNLAAAEQEGEVEGVNEKRRRYLEALHDLFYSMAISKNLVILGRGGQVLFKDFPPALHVKVIAPYESRVERVCKTYNLDEAAAAFLIAEQDRDRQEYLRHVFGADWFDLSFYDLVVNTGLLGMEEAACLIGKATRLKESMDGVTVRELDEWLLDSAEQPPAAHEKDAAPSPFAHSSEEDFARVLDFYRIKWLYEPRTFPLQWDSEGNVTEAFSPDFYLPEQDLYVELTTQRQKLVWKKNKKVRRLKELYPDVNIKVIYERDYRGLLQKYGIEK